MSLRDTIEEAYEAVPALVEIAEADLRAVFERDPACKGYVQPFLFFKGFLALQTHRVAHWLSKEGRETLAFYLQSRSSELFQVDINPATRSGRGVFVDHGTGIVLGETAGVPARLVNCPTCEQPARSMDHTLADAVYDYVI